MFSKINTSLKQELENQKIIISFLEKEIMEKKNNENLMFEKICKLNLFEDNQKIHNYSKFNLDFDFFSTIIVINKF